MAHSPEPRHKFGSLKDPAQDFSFNLKSTIPTGLPPRPIAYTEKKVKLKVKSLHELANEPMKAPDMNKTFHRPNLMPINEEEKALR